MKLLKNPYINAAVIAAISLFYAAMFIIASGSMEFQHSLSHGQTLSNDFWNNWTVFLQQGNLKYFGYAYLILAVVILALSFVRGKRYDEYQVGILSVSLIATGIMLLFFFPFALLFVLSDRNYAIEMLTFLVVAHWSVFLLVNLIYSIKWCRG